jgi:CRISPR/Cas system-associated exonuclease Cas4 (RecB family)
MSEHASTAIIRASELGQYAFCARSWWLSRVKGYRSTNVREMALGQSEHLAHGRAVRSYQRLQRLALGLLLAAALAVTAGIYLLSRGL